MKVILLEDIKSVGKKGQVLDASDGYARNFLIPKKLAVLATKANMNDLEQKSKAAEAKNAKELENAKLLAKEIEAKKITIEVKLGENGKLFGSVTSKEIAQVLEEKEGIVVDKKKIVIPEPIKTTGEKTVEIKLSHNISAKLTVNITGV